MVERFPIDSGERLPHATSAITAKRAIIRASYQRRDWMEYNSAVTDFVGLCRAARELPGADTHDRLWSAWFALPEWFLISAPSPVGPLPFSHFVNGQRRVLAFSTAHRAGGYAQAMRIGPLMPLAPPLAMQTMPQLKTYGVYGFLVDIGPDGFDTSLDNLWGMFHRFRAAPPPAPPSIPSGPAAGTVEWFRALPAWHVVMTAQDRSMPELTSQGSDLVAQVYSSAHAVAHFAVHAPIVVMPPAQVLTLLMDIELVRFVRFDNHLVVDLVDLHVG